ncbi:MAG: 5-formyltetrahydrofolate cyclo-ligase [Deltaproteobacteria bacterium GWC2_56_8]|nr:MAG: 5-formyltetrahydrofolate cyclo-ligase [Deltaproteobacteria bacterium GWB2_55_19]OGP33527.1 MAG: 5-formyltetrahydrofolate cyclo-ligase [Deltaproteobacteria bacterium GWC2_56_8]
MKNSVLKERVRSAVLERRREMAFEDVYRKSSLIQKRLIGSPFYAEAGVILLYSSFSNEVLTDELFETAIREGREAAYPRVLRGGGRHLAFFKVKSLKELAPGSYDIPEPAEREERAQAGSFDLVVVPGVAFDEKGGRLGYGKGYYDRALSGIECPIVALAYEFQVLKEDIPVEPHDVRVSAIVTEKRLIATG